MNNGNWPYANANKRNQVASFFTLFKQINAMINVSMCVVCMHEYVIALWERIPLNWLHIHNAMSIHCRSSLWRGCHYLYCIVTEKLPILYQNGCTTSSAFFSCACCINPKLQVFATATCTLSMVRLLRISSCRPIEWGRCGIYVDYLQLLHPMCCSTETYTRDTSISGDSIA